MQDTSKANLNGTLFFGAGDPIYGSALWKSDGTAEGTVVVKDIFPFELTNVNDTLFFKAIDDVHGEELWKSDGTAAGTVLVKDIYPGDDDSYPVGLTDVNGTLFFVAEDGVHGPELWKSDGTAAGTVLVKDIYPEGDWSWAPGGLTEVNGTLFFRASDGVHGLELWKSDGTAAGTVMVKDINPVYSSVPHELTDVNGTLFFSADDGDHGSELWKSDGTAAGTLLVKDINYDDEEIEHSSDPSELTEVNGTLFFSAEDDDHGRELWKSDGTAAGTLLVKDINEEWRSSDPSELTDVNGTLFFSADDGFEWDGFHGIELWKSDGTPAGTVMVKNIPYHPPDDSDSSYPRELTNVNGTLFFTADDGTHGREPWKSDGTEAGTVLVKDINPRTADSCNPYEEMCSEFTEVSGMLFFKADDGLHGTELWALDVREDLSIFIPLVTK